jgi:hypothetical protein
MEEQLIEINGQQVTKEQFQEMQNNPKIRLKEIAPNKYKTLEKMEG